MEQKQQLSKFTRYEVFVITILTLMQFTVILDFMVMAPLSAVLLPELHITTVQFGIAVSAYAFSAGIAAFATAGFADKYDRKKLLTFFYTGFVLGTFLCGIAPSYTTLVAARIVTGMFGGVVGSIGAAIITDLFPLEKRGRVMGFAQMGFPAGQVLGLPIALYLNNIWGWHSPFLMIVGLSLGIGLIMVLYLKPVTEHLKIKSDRNPVEHLFKTLGQPDYLLTFGAMILLATGGFMMMPFGSAFTVNNLGISMDHFPMIYAITGIFSMAAGPIAGKLSDKFGKLKVFMGGTLLTMIIVVIYSHMGITPIWLLIVINVLLFAGIFFRMIPASTLMTAIPQPQDRGAFMSINSSIQQLSGGVAAILAGLIVTQLPSGKILHYDILGFVVIGAMAITAVMIYLVNKRVTQKLQATKPI